ncbi:MAG: hypothetical protein GPJ54_09495 [Candidatus Heimdallarchaeota archaeon]|nr:hypothetical protein [Candidatus Heimdallarchaeota archaeon]
MSEQKEPICLSEGFFTSVLLQPDGHIAYFGTNQGCVEIWDLEVMEKKTEVRYLIFNEFNEQIPIQDQVVNLAAPANFEYVYAFMGVAAYCIDTNLQTIIQQIPISENVLWGSVSPEKGEIGVLTTSGYLSRWSPTFFERTGSIEFDKKLENGYVLHDFDESRIIIALGKGKVIVGNLEGERYVINLEIPISDQFLNSSGYDKNPFYTVHLVEGCIFVTSNNVESEIEIHQILKDGRLNSEFQLRNLIKLKENEGAERNYISDLRFSRDSRDRYTAELESLGQNTHHESTVSEDSKTLHYALQEYQNENLDTKSKALSVINRMSDRYNISLQSIQFSRSRHNDSTSIIENAKHYDDLTNSRQIQIQRTIFLSLSISIILLFLGSSFKITMPVLIILISVGLLQTMIIIYIKLINSDPNLPWVREYKALRFLNILTLLVSLIIGVLRFNGINIPLIDSM